MPLNFGGGQLFPQGTGVLSSDYRSAGSHQAENLKFLAHSGNANNWIEIHTVPTGKTYYVSGVIIHYQDAAVVRCSLGTGGGGAEVVFMAVMLSSTNGQNLNFNTPIKFSSDTRIAVRTNTATQMNIALIGWEE